MYTKLSRSILIIFLTLILQMNACGKESLQTRDAVTPVIEVELPQEKSEQASTQSESKSRDQELLTIEVEKQKAEVVRESIVETRSTARQAEVSPVTPELKASNTRPKSDVPSVSQENLEELSPAQAMLDLAQYKGKVVYLDFWASWCGPCKQSFPWMQKMQEKYPDDLVVVAVNLDEDKALAEQFLANRKVNFRIVYDQLWQAGREYEIFGLPYSFVYNRSGKLVGKHGGFTPGDDINLESALNNLFALGE